MIVREVMLDPDKVLEHFDWLHDSKDTWRWLLSSGQPTEKLPDVIKVIKKMIAACPEDWLHWMVYS